MITVRYPGVARPEEALPPGALRGRRNLVPLPYRRVSVQPYDGAMDESAIAAHLLGRESYRRTDFVVLRAPAERYAVAAISRAGGEELFSPITGVEVLALPDTCRYVRAPATDCGNRSALAEAAAAAGLDAGGTLVVEGLYDHVNFIHHPDPILLRVVEVTPPFPPKLYHLVQRVLAYADLPPIRLELEQIDLTSRARETGARSFLAPCRSGGLDQLGGPVAFLDERPPRREAWVLVGCERSLEFHRHYYGDEPPRVELCPRKLAGSRGEPTLVKCCLLEYDLEREGQVMVVPWGSDLDLIERALHHIVEEANDA
ncbi:MAG TPA: hypothetical protein VFG53_15580 [Anaeromyxobacter sp.]|nr:hypothetical protein [Anaeromyxobacter sp.]